ncbi:hypothetical protein PCA31118_04748 [Pandoraea captiosa]|uniref:Uncharacterized protein n=1 Tax=Pandoraea captiosa TaxID=2508302 RepID=A0A5E5AMD4_9BURK|nr:hypothetical protein PCA31118_04748 [Pandoraea captiosa]
MEDGSSRMWPVGAARALNGACGFPAGDLMPYPQLFRYHRPRAARRGWVRSR